jgi:hypothetical protein
VHSTLAAGKGRQAPFSAGAGLAGQAAFPAATLTYVMVVDLPAAECRTERRCADIPHIVGDVDRNSESNDLVDAVKQIGGQIDPAGGRGRRPCMATPSAGRRALARAAHLRRAQDEINNDKERGQDKQPISDPLEHPLDARVRTEVPAPADYGADRPGQHRYRQQRPVRTAVMRVQRRVHRSILTQLAAHRLRFPKPTSPRLTVTAPTG